MNKSGDIFKELMREVSNSSNKAYIDAENIKNEATSSIERLCTLRGEFWRMEESLEKILDIVSSSDPYRINLIIHNAMVGLGLKEEK